MKIETGDWETVKQAGGQLRTRRRRRLCGNFWQLGFSLFANPGLRGGAGSLVTCGLCCHFRGAAGRGPLPLFRTVWIVVHVQCVCRETACAVDRVRIALDIRFVLRTRWRSIARGGWPWAPRRRRFAVLIAGSSPRYVSAAAYWSVSGRSRTK
jgi:hypothetical protein